MKLFKVKIWMRQSKEKFDFEFSQYPKLQIPHHLPLIVLRTIQGMNNRPKYLMAVKAV